MTRDDKAMIRIGLIAAVLGFLSPLWAQYAGLNLHWVLVVCTSVSFVCCMFVLVRGSIPRKRKPKQ